MNPCRGIRVVQCIEHLGIGGAERLCAGIVRELSIMGATVAVACLKELRCLGRELRDDGFPVHAPSKRPRFNVHGMLHLAIQLRRNRPDVLHTHCFSANTWGRLAGILAGVPAVVATEHNEAGWIAPRKHAPVNRVLSRFTDKIAVVSETVRDSFIRRERIAPEKLTVIPNGVDLDQFAPGDRHHARKALGFDASVPLIGYVGRLSWEKGGDVFIDALYGLKKRGVRFQAFMVGDGSQRSEYERTIHQRALGSELRLAGPRRDVRPYLDACSVFVCPSREEAFGLAVAEAMAMGVPVVASDAGALPRLVHNDVTGLLVERNNSRALANAVTATIDRPRHARRRARVAREMVRENYSLRTTARQYLELYTTLVA